MYGYNEIVILDLETTGLDSADDEIIEIGAVRIFADGSMNTFSTLVKCKKDIPVSITELTGIDQSMLKDAMELDTALRALLDFVGDSTIFAHNASFDASFLERALIAEKVGVLKNNFIDTLSLSRILCPNLLDHRLETVAAYFGWEMDNAHRALDDAMATAAVARGLWQILLSMPDKTLDMVEQIAASAGMVNFMSIFNSARLERMKSCFEPPETEKRFSLDLENEFGESPDGNIDFSPELIFSFFLENSSLSSVLKRFKPRLHQQQMAELVTGAFFNGELLMVEAGTGVGKSFAYLIPALFWAVSASERVVISTYTKTLQEQLFFSDIPTLSRALPFKFNALLLKGKGNYICLRRTDRFLKNPNLLSIREREALLYISSWLSMTKSGDISENTSFLNSQNFYMWEKIRADGHTCVARKCPFFGECFVYKVRNKVKQAQIVIVNHALLLSDLDRTILGDYEYLIIDEAHNIERVAAETLGGELSQWRFRSAFDAIFSEMTLPSGTLVFLMTALNDDEKYKSLYQKAAQSVIAARAFGDTFFMELAQQMENTYHWREQEYSVRKRYDSGNPIFQKIEPLGLEFVKYIKRAVEMLKKFAESAVPKNKESERLLEELQGQVAKISEMEQELLFALSPVEKDFVYWMESPTSIESTDARLCWSPLNSGEILCKSIYDRLGAAVFTSATLTIAGDFNNFLENIALAYAPRERVNYHLLGSPFDYERQLKIAVARFMPEPTGANERIFVQRLSEIIFESSRRMRKGTLVLFTSNNMLRQTFESLHKPFRDEGIRLLAQNISGSHSALSKVFCRDVESVLLGTESFWQGVDIPGSSLEVLIIAKLPFGVPDEPYSEAKQEQIRARGGDPFDEYVIPQAVIRFRQGMGRVIRSETDRGVLLVMDPRIVSRRYGEKFLKSLPTGIIETFEPEQIYRLLEDQLV